MRKMESNKKGIIETYKAHATDTGSPEVQIAILTSRINYLSEHFKKYPKDFGSRGGFLKLIGQRRRLLEYLKKHSKDKYKKLIEKLELRK
ncbi:MAG: 30S ribosomal protein S15 [Elusimicrobiota bacterium]